MDQQKFVKKEELEDEDFLLFNSNKTPSGETWKSVTHISPVDQQDEEPLKPVKDEEDEEPEEDEYLCGETSSSVRQVIITDEHKQPVIKDEEPEDDDYLYCEDCRSFFISECEVHGPALFIRDTLVPMGVNDRARQTLPPGLEIRKSSIPNAGLGVFNKGETVPVGVHFGPYQGDLVDREEAMNSVYS
ncbi:hypothetical protein PGIGA_G00059830, partial [Pangasianodon gigas]|nr:hypothetical protein [Pangasianodon gigas]